MGRELMADDGILLALQCPICGQPLRGFGAAGERRAGSAAVRSLRCPAGHSFDVARHGYVNVAVGASGRGARGDDGAMLAARDRILTAGHFAPLATAVAEAVAAAVAGGRDVPGPLLEVGAGTGHYLAHALDVLPDRLGIAVDISPHALRRCARAHERMAAIGADVWRPWPIADGGVAAVLCVFGPRNPGQMARVLAPGGALVLVTPGPDHLRELIEPLGMIGVAPDKEERVAAQLAGFELAEEQRLRFDIDADRAVIGDLVAMGPSARHLSPAALAAGLASLPPRLTVTADLRLRAAVPGRLRGPQGVSR